MRLKLTIWVIMLSLVISAMPVCRTGSVHATYQESAANITPTISTDNQTNQETPNEKLDPGVAERLSTLKPTDDIRLIVEIEMPVDIMTYKNYGLTTPRDKEIEEISAEIRTRAKAAIETLPDTSVIGSIQNRYSLWVQTKVGNIEALAEMPEIVRIYIGPQMCSSIPIMLLSPNNGSLGCPVDHPSFSWSPYRETTKFKFVLAKDAAMTQVVKEAEVTNRTYDYDGKLDYGTNYYWRVFALEPEFDDQCATFSFQTEAAPLTPSEAPPPPAPWPTALIIVIILVLAAGAGLLTWFVLAKRHREK